jgi:hypothetical protein
MLILTFFRCNQISQSEVAMADRRRRFRVVRNLTRLSVSFSLSGTPWARLSAASTNCKYTSLSDDTSADVCSDVFMDSVNRERSMGMIIQAAQRSIGRQFIFITPQAMNNVKHTPDVKIIRMSDPERNQTALNFRQS